MKVTLLCVGKTDDKYLLEGIAKYEARLKHYVNFNLVIVPDIKNSKHLSQEEQKGREAELIKKHLKPGDTLILLDEGGKEYRSVQFADFFNKMMVNSTQHIVFVIGGAYGFDSQLYQMAHSKISLSRMTFSHQMIRLFFVEQVYRAFSILKGEPYHHE